MGSLAGGRPRSLKGEIVIEYLNNFPDTPSLTMAKMIYAENKSLFTDEEDARGTVRYYRGSYGEKQRYGKLFDFDGKYNPFGKLPEGLTDFKDWEPYPLDCKKALVLGDVHIPYHDRGALEIALEYGYAQGIDTLIFAGDFADHFSISRWEKDPRRKDFNAEIETVYSILTTIREAFPDHQIIWKIGNHEERYVSYMEVKAPEMLGVKQFEFRNIFSLDHFNIQSITDKRIMKIGRLNVIHGHEFGKGFSSSVNPARGLYLKGKENAICGHLHRTSNHSENSMNDSFTGCWSIGCLCDLHPRYLPINAWNWGFGVVEKFCEKEFQVHNKKILNGKVYSA